MSTADMLTDLGYAVVEAASAEKALALLDGGMTIDMLIIDHLMPGMSGADLCRIARGRWPDLSVLIVSGYADVDEMSGDMPRLTKSFRQVDLVACVRELAVKMPKVSPSAGIPITFESHFAERRARRSA